MKKYILAILICLMAVPVWAATVYVGYVTDGVYYQSGATQCSDLDTGDTSGDMEAAATAAGASGVLVLCSNLTGTQIDSDSKFDIPNDGMEIDLQTYTLDSDGADVDVIYCGGHDNLNIHGQDADNHATLTNSTQAGINGALGDPTDDSTFRYITMHNFTKNGIKVDGADNYAGYLTVYDVGDAGILWKQAGNTSTTVEHCEVYEYGSEGDNDDGIQAGDGDGIVYVQYNYVHDQVSEIDGAAGIDVNDDDASLITAYVLNNRVANAHWGISIGSEQAGTYTAYSNVLYGISDTGIAFRSNGTLNAYNNTVIVEDTKNPFYSTNVSSVSKAITMKNNIAYVNGGFCFRVLDTTNVTIDSDYNDWYRIDNSNIIRDDTGDGTTYTITTWRAATDDDDNSITDNPLFVNPTSNDYRLTTNSPAATAGTPIVGVTTDYSNNAYHGTTPSIGALQQYFTFSGVSF